MRARACRRGRQTSGPCPRSRATCRRPAAAARTAPDTDTPVPASRLRRFHHRVEAAGRRVGGEQLRVVAPARDRREAADRQHLGCIGAPGQHVGRDRPLVGRLADRRHDRAPDRTPARARRRGRAHRRRRGLREHVARRKHVGGLRRLAPSGIPATRVSRSCVTGEPFWESRVAPLCDTAALIRR